MITLSSDFGSPYPAAMRGVLLNQTDARLVDIAHEFPRQDVQATAFWLCQVLPYFPPAIHLVVVDPGVGTERSALVIRAGEHALVGPDNGVLLPAARTLADDIDVFEVEYDRGEPAAGEAAGEISWPPVPESSTFHGRDVFAPAAAQVYKAGVGQFEDREGFRATDEYVDLTLPEPSFERDGIIGRAIAVDGFGNVITNIPGDVLADRFGDHVKVNGIWASIQRAYADVDEGHRVVTVGSHGNVELAVNQGRGSETFGIASGGRVRLTW
jgi:S-adenosylmethionine hydrolase